MKKIGLAMIVAGALLIGYWGLYDPMDSETALARHGYTDRPATTEEILAARETWFTEYPSIWFVIGGGVLVAVGFLTRRAH